MLNNLYGLRVKRELLNKEDDESRYLVISLE